MTSNPPLANHSAEEMVVGFILRNPKEVISLGLSPDDFDKDILRAIFVIISEMQNTGETVTLSAIARKCSKIKIDERFLLYLWQSAPEEMNSITDYINSIRDSSDRRKIARALKEAEKGLSDSVPTADVIQELQNSLMSITPNEKTRVLNIADLNPRKIHTTPPEYILKINGTDVRFLSGELLSWRRFKTKVFETLDFVPIEPRNWDLTISKMMERLDHETAPADASKLGQLAAHIKSWFERMCEASEPVDLAVGHYVTREHCGMDYIFFKAKPLLRFLRSEGNLATTAAALWNDLREFGVVRKPIRLGNKSSTLWGLPVNFWKKWEGAEDDDGDIPPADF